jgi:hypothetical protein
MRRGKKLFGGGRNTVEDRMVRNIDKLARMEELFSDLEPQLLAALQSGASADEIYSKFERLAAVRAVHIAMREKDPGKAMAAIRDILDRRQGKPTERKEISHRLGKMQDQELQALLASELEDLKSAKQIAPGVMASQEALEDSDESEDSES